MTLRWLLSFFCLPIFCSSLEVGQRQNVRPDVIQDGLTEEIGPQPVTEEEALFLRRISEFWQEGEFQIAKSQIEEFIAQYPQSSFSDALCSALGDLYLREKNFSQALSFYSRIQSPGYSARIFLNRMQCIYQMQWYATLADECESVLRENANLEPEHKLHATYFLAVALYQQCLNASKDPETLLKLAQRAEPYFEILFQSELSDEVAQSFAHLCCILKDFPKACGIYKDLAKKDPSIEEEMLFQAALIQSEYDKDGALQAFDAISKMGQNRAKDAAYNRLVLTFDTGRYAELTQAKEAFFSEMPEGKKELARLFLGRSLLALKKYPEAASELQTYILNADETSESYPAALLSLIEAAYQADDLAGIDAGIDKLTRLSSNQSAIQNELPKALFSRAQVLKKNQKPEEARLELERLLGNFPKCNQKAQALFELAHLTYQKKEWTASRSWAHRFVSECPNHELAPFAWRYLISSSSEIAAAGTEKESKKQLIYDLIAALNQKEGVSPSERIDWQFLYVKTLIQIGSYSDAMAVLQTLLETDSAEGLNASIGPREGNAWLLLALCYRDGLGDLDRFCETAEKALSKKADLIDPAQVHVLLFNAYLEKSRSHPEFLDASAEHLYAAFKDKAQIQSQNLLWLADFYFNRLSESGDGQLADQLANKAAAILEHCLRGIGETAEFEPYVCKLAKCYSILGQVENQIALLEKLTDPIRRISPVSEKEANLLLGEAYARKGENEKALNLFDKVIAASPTVRSAAAASASLQSARLTLSSIKQSDSPDFMKVAAQLKNLVVQRTLANEPCHLEAALDYIDLQTRFEKEDKINKKLSLLTKTKDDFARSDDLLSKDYHEARSKLPRKNKIYNDYMCWIEAEILFTQAELMRETLTEKDSEMQKELQAKAKVLLLQIIDGKAHPLLTDRVQRALQSNETKPEAEA